jgi:hypothetical protein
VSSVQLEKCRLLVLLLEFSKIEMNRDSASENTNESSPVATAHGTLTSRLRNYLHDACGGGRRRDPSAPSAIAADTQRLAHFAVHCTIKQSSDTCVKPGRTRSEARVAVARTRTEACLAVSIRRMHEKHALLFRSMMERLQIDRQVDFYLGFSELAVDLFGEEEVSWPKILALYAFGARLGNDKKKCCFFWDGILNCCFPFKFLKISVQYSRCNI